MLRVRRHAVRNPRPVRFCSEQDQLLMEVNGAVVVQGMRATDCGATYGVRRYGSRALVGCAAAVWLVMFGCHMAMAMGTEYISVPGLPIHDGRSFEMELTEGTGMNVDLSPDGRNLAFDLLGDVYVMPAKGGAATQITRGLAWDRRPVWSPDETAARRVGKECVSTCRARWSRSHEK